ncbi:Uncharacterised protein [Vibrio cholerae]|nr:Uncharacterised protein [Vibrio cholerae]CSC10762.1 Uncharacterised protein [Vibrio cholerae]
MRDTAYRINHRLLESQLRIFRITYRVKAIGDRAFEIGFTIARRQGRTKLRFICIGGFMQINMQQNQPVLCHHRHQ